MVSKSSRARKKAALAELMVTNPEAANIQIEQEKLKRHQKYIERCARLKNDPQKKEQVRVQARQSEKRKRAKRKERCKVDIEYKLIRQKCRRAEYDRAKERPEFRKTVQAYNEKIKSDPVLHERRKQAWNKYTTTHKAVILQRAKNFASKHWAKRIILDSKRVDQEHGRYVEVNHIDEPFIAKTLAAQESKCAYCNQTMLFGEGVKRNQPLGLTIQRIDNAMGHVKANCILCCFLCNIIAAQVGHQRMLQDGLRYHEKEIRFCSCDTHVGDRVLPADQFSPGWCKVCARNYITNWSRERSRKRKQQRVENLILLKKADHDFENKCAHTIDDENAGVDSSSEEQDLCFELSGRDADSAE